MKSTYPHVTTRFLRQDERLFSGQDLEMPLVIEATSNKSLDFLTTFLHEQATSILADIAQYGGVLLRGFEVRSDADFERTVLSIQGLRGIRAAFMSEEGRTQVDGAQFVLHTNAAYKTGGTLYLGGFHSENYYSPDVPAYICFHCQQPSIRGGETGIMNTRKIYEKLPKPLQDKLEKNSFFVGKWLVTDIMRRYNLSRNEVIQLAEKFSLPLLRKGRHEFVAFYKPSVYINDKTKSKALQINFFELDALNPLLRQCFLADYPGSAWFWHRVVWQSPAWLLKALEKIYLTMALLIFSRHQFYETSRSKLMHFLASIQLDAYENRRVGSCFTKTDMQLLATLMHDYYVSCLWQPNDVLLLDNTQVVHAGMPGNGLRKIRALICNPLEIPYTADASGIIHCKERDDETIGFYCVRN